MPVHRVAPATIDKLETVVAEIESGGRPIVAVMVHAGEWVIVTGRRGPGRPPKVETR